MKAPDDAAARLATRVLDAFDGRRPNPHAFDADDARAAEDSIVEYFTRPDP